MNIYELVFLVQLLGFAFVFLVKTLNVMRVGKLYSFELVWIGLVAQIFLYALGWIVVMLDTSTLFYSVVFRFESWMWLFVGALVFAELMFFLGDRAKGGIEPYKSRDARGLNNR